MKMKVIVYDRMRKIRAIAKMPDRGWKAAGKLSNSQNESSLKVMSHRDVLCSSGPV